MADQAVPAGQEDGAAAAAACSRPNAGEGQPLAPAREQRRGQVPEVQPPRSEHPVPFRRLPAGPTDWDPRVAAVTLNATLDGCIVPSEAAPEGARVSYRCASRPPRQPDGWSNREGGAGSRLQGGRGKRGMQCAPVFCM